MMAQYRKQYLCICEGQQENVLDHVASLVRSSKKSY